MHDAKMREGDLGNLGVDIDEGDAAIDPSRMMSGKGRQPFRRIGTIALEKSFGELSGP